MGLERNAKGSPPGSNEKTLESQSKLDEEMMSSGDIIIWALMKDHLIVIMVFSFSFCSSHNLRAKHI